jgi:SAM-dependent methyltransferase
MNNLKSEIPRQIYDEIPCLNNMGYQKVDLDEYSKAFIEFASGSTSKVLEIGCAYGGVTHQVMARGGKIIACDMEEKHLALLQEFAPKKFLSNLELLQGVFPDAIKLEPASIDAILISRVIHFLEGDEIKRGFDKLHNWLKKNGKLYLTVVSPYVESLIEEFLPIYEHRAKDGEEWPGIIRNHNELAHRHAPFLGNFLHVFDIPQFKKLLPEHGFNIDKIEYFDYPNEAISSNNKGHIGFVATKV